MLKKYLFIMSPNNSGSHVLAALIMSSKKVAALPGLEGLFLNSFGEPPVKNPTPKDAFMFSSIEDSIRNISVERWKNIKIAWDQEWDKFTDRPIKLEKSPPLICAHDKYPKVFESYKYIVMPRNPYAVAEGTRRSILERSGYDIGFLDAIKHAVRVLEICDEIVSVHEDNAIYFSYEEFTKDPEAIKNKIISFIPELNDIKVYEKYDIKKTYYSGITNMNDKQIDRIPNKDLDIMKEYVEYKKSLSDINSFINLY